MADIEKNTSLDASAEKKAKAAKPAKVKKDKAPLKQRLGSWFRSYKAEFKKIVWTSPKATFSNSVMVIVAIIVFAIAIGILDYLFSQGIIGLSKII